MRLNIVLWYKHSVGRRDKRELKHGDGLEGESVNEDRVYHSMLTWIFGVSRDQIKKND